MRDDRAATMTDLNTPHTGIRKKHHIPTDGLRHLTDLSNETHERTPTMKRGSWPTTWATMNVPTRVGMTVCTVHPSASGRGAYSSFWTVRIGKFVTARSWVAMRQWAGVFMPQRTAGVRELLVGNCGCCNRSWTGRVLARPGAKREFRQREVWGQRSH